MAHGMHHGMHAMHDDPSMHNMPMHRCSMNMLWNTQIFDTCIVFRSWHVTSNTVFVFSFFAIVALGAFYEWLRVFQSSVDRRIALSLSASGKGKGRLVSVSEEGPETESEETGLLTGRRAVKAGTPIPPLARALRASLYGATVFLSFFLMLVFMTYNAYLILAVVLGAAIGHYAFTPSMDVDAILEGSASAGKGMACH